MDDSPQRRWMLRNRDRMRAWYRDYFREYRALHGDKINARRRAARAAAKAAGGAS